MTTSVVVLAYFYILTRLPTLSTRSIACRAIIARMIPVTLTPTVFTGIHRFCTTSRSGTFPRPGSTVFKMISLLCRGALAASRGGPPLRADRLDYRHRGRPLNAWQCLRPPGLLRAWGQPHFGLHWYCGRLQIHPLQSRSQNRAPQVQLFVEISWRSTNQSVC